MAGKKLKIGIIGCGGVANYKHLPSLVRLPELCEITAFCDIIKERAVMAAKQFGMTGAKVFTDYRELLDDHSIDVVHVLTPNVYHSPITVAALMAGMHVMCEKPMAISYSDAKAMADAAAKFGRKLTIGYQNRFRDDAQMLHHACSAGALGDIYFAKAHAVRRRGVPTWGVFPNKALQGGGPLIDIGTHALDLTLWAMNNYEPVQVSGSVYYKMADKFEGNEFGPWDPKTYEVEDSAFGFIKMKNGATIFLEASWALNTTDVKEAATTLCGTDAGAEIKSIAGGYDLTFNTAKYGQLIDERPVKQSGVAYFSEDGSEPGYREAKQWLESILNDYEPLVRPAQALVVTQILEAIYKSHETGKAVVF